MNATSSETSTKRKPVLPCASMRSHWLVRDAKCDTNEAGLVAKMDTVDASPKHEPRSKVWPVERTRLPAGCIDCPVPDASYLWFPSLKESTISYGSPIGLSTAEKVALPAG